MAFPRARASAAATGSRVMAACAIRVASCREQDRADSSIVTIQKNAIDLCNTLTPLDIFMGRVEGSYYVIGLLNLIQARAFLGTSSHFQGRNCGQRTDH